MRAGYAFNGVNGATGQPLQGPLSDHDLAALAAGNGLDLHDEIELRGKSILDGLSYAPVGGYNAAEIAEVGWGLVMPAATNCAMRVRNQAIRRALAPLLEFRRERAGQLFR